ncbi:MAG TPA: hypothetical protein PLQ86_02040 [Candidatus Aminicenantes bacterium]|nr:hypothetical protein [Candidatus Aminicenantes bacterium]
MAQTPGLLLHLLLPIKGIERRPELSPETGEAGIGRKQNDEDAENDEDADHADVHCRLFPASPRSRSGRPGEKKERPAPPDGRNAPVPEESVLLEFGNFAPLFILAQVEPEEKHREKNDDPEECLKKAVHNNIPSAEKLRFYFTQGERIVKFSHPLELCYNERVKSHREGCADADL